MTLWGIQFLHHLLKYKRVAIYGAQEIFESFSWCWSVPPFQGFKRGTRRALWLWPAFCNLSYVFWSSMRVRSCPLGVKCVLIKAIGQFCFDVIGCECQVGLMVSFKSTTRLVLLRRNNRWSLACDGSWMTRREYNEGTAPVNECTWNVLVMRFECVLLSDEVETLISFLGRYNLSHGSHRKKWATCTGNWSLWWRVENSFRTCLERLTVEYALHVAQKLIWKILEIPF